MKKRWIALLCVLGLLLALTACGEDTPEEAAIPAGAQDDAAADVQEPAETAEPAAQGELPQWAVYWYLCGSDLESNGGFATADLGELTEVALPADVQVVIETGGSSTWHNDVMDAEKLQRWVYNSDGFYLVDEQPSASMGDAQTLADFLAYAKENYPAEKTAVIFWNHGGGSVSGAAFDELYGMDSLTLDEMYAAFSAVWDLSAEQPPLELIGFDTCLMATLDVASTFSDIASYMVASEEVEPANGWYYSQWAGALAEDPYMNGAELGRVICDAYYAGCEAVGTEQSATLSLTDLSGVGALLDAYESFGAECLSAACADPAFFSQFARAAYSSENYGGNTREQGYTNMVDLGDLARKSLELAPSGQSVLDALNACVLYQVGGPYRAEASGLSCYYSYSGDTDDFSAYAALGAGTAFKYYYAYGLTGELDESGMEYLETLDISELPALPALSETDWDGAPVEVQDDGVSVLTLGADAADVLASIGFRLYYMDEESDTMMLLGTDNDINADWDNGIFYDNFRGVWGAIDGCLVYMELSNETEDYNLYSVPVLLNGEEYNLQVVYDFNTEQWKILGAWKGIDENGMADKELRLLTAGDELTTIWKLATLSGDDDFELYTADTITVTDETAFGEAPLFDGTYCIVYEMTDAAGNTACSQAVQFDVADGEIYTSALS